MPEYSQLLRVKTINLKEYHEELEHQEPLKKYHIRMRLSENKRTLKAPWQAMEAANLGRSFEKSKVRSYDWPHRVLAKSKELERRNENGRMVHSGEKEDRDWRRRIGVDCYSPPKTNILDKHMPREQEDYKSKLCLLKKQKKSPQKEYF
jgi:hypothetical protein